MPPESAITGNFSIPPYLENGVQQAPVIRIEDLLPRLCGQMSAMFPKLTLIALTLTGLGMLSGFAYVLFREKKKWAPACFYASAIMLICSVFVLGYMFAITYKAWL